MSLTGNLELAPIEKEQIETIAESSKKSFDEDRTFLLDSEKNKALPKYPFCSEKESARLYRQELLLQEAQIAIDCKNAIIDNPRIRQSELIEQVTRDNKTLHPNVLWRYVDEYVARVNSTKSLIWELSGGESGLRGEDAQAELTRSIFSALTNSEVPPRHPIIIDDRFPFAISVFLHPEDFDRADPRTNIGGFYLRDDILHNLIAVRMSEKDHLNNARNLVLIHEQGHSDNSVFKTAMRNFDLESLQKRTFLWGYENTLNARAAVTTMEQLMDNYPDALQDYTKWLNNELLKPDDVKWDQLFYQVPKEILAKYPDLEEATLVDKQTKIFDAMVSSTKRCLEYLLTLAKDELLAEFSAQTSAPYTLTLKNSSAYDYIEERLKVKEQDPLMPLLRSLYHNSLDKLAAPVLYFINSYETRFVTKRAGLIAKVLERIPLYRWEDQLKSSMFYKELEELSSFESEVDTVYNSKDKYVSHLTEKEAKVFEDLHGLVNTQLTMKVYNSDSTKPILPAIREVQNMFRSKVQQEVNGLRVTKLVLAYLEISDISEKFWNEGGSIVGTRKDAMKILEIEQEVKNRLWDRKITLEEALEKLKEVELIAESVV